MLREESEILLYSVVAGLFTVVLTCLYRFIMGATSGQKGMPDGKNKDKYMNRAPRGESDFSLFQIIRQEGKVTQDSKGKHDRAVKKWSTKGQKGTQSDKTRKDRKMDRTNRIIKERRAKHRMQGSQQRKVEIKTIRMVVQLIKCGRPNRINHIMTGRPTTTGNPLTKRIHC